jgi:hypothetical protein
MPSGSRLRPKQEACANTAIPANSSELFGQLFGGSGTPRQTPREVPISILQQDVKCENEKCGYSLRGLPSHHQADPAAALKNLQTLHPKTDSAASK